MPILRGHARVACATYARRAAMARATRAIRPILAFWGSFWGEKFPKMGDSLPWTPGYRQAKFDGDSFIIGGEIRIRTNKQTNKHTHI